MDAIPFEKAAELCRQIREQNRRRMFTYNGWWCWGCDTFTKGDIRQRCFNNTPGCRGCDQVNQRFDSSN